ncbi:MAG: CAP domain-containing protein [Actinomycetes bacterium]
MSLNHRNAWRARSAVATLLAASLAVGVAAVCSGRSAQASVLLRSSVAMTAADGYLVDQVNTLRAAYGLPALVVAPQLEDLAQDWSVHMAAANALSHNPSGATTTWSRYCTSYWAENVGTGASASALWSAYAASTAHRANILNPHLTNIGIATVDRKSASGIVTQWNTMEFSGPCSTSRWAQARSPWGLWTERITPASTSTVAGFEGKDWRVSVGATVGMTSSPLYWSPVRDGVDDYAYFDLKRSTTVAAYGQMALRQGLDLTNATKLTLTAQATTPDHGPVVATLYGVDCWDTSVTIGSVTITGAKGALTVTIPAAARRYWNHLFLRVQSTQLDAQGGTLASRSARVIVYQLDVAA